MGKNYKYYCSTCAYEFQGSGKRDQGMRTAIYNTYNCLNCRNSFDLYVNKIPGNWVDTPIQRSLISRMLGKQKYQRVFIEEKLPSASILCGMCQSNNVIEWNFSCPKCQDKMINKGLVALWD